jgi:TetR/AcrR family transcriptional regulator
MKLTGVVNLEKNTIILEVSMLEFAKHGYKNASTNAIAKAANLSKGLIFHYYESKEALFHAAIEEAIARINETIHHSFHYQSDDLFARLNELMTYKTLLLTHPDPAVSFITTLALDDNHQLRDRVRSIQEAYNESLFNQLFTGLDMSRYRMDFTLQEMMSISMMVLEKAGEQLLLNKVSSSELATLLESTMTPWIQTLQRLFIKEPV